jgi:DNA-binding CsgD family transcriptional regulator
VHIDTAAVIAHEGVEKIGQADLDPREFFYEVAERIGRVVPFDAAGWLTLDPDTLLSSGALETEKPPEFVRSVWRNELLEPDVHKIADLARRRRAVASLSELDEETLDQSPRVQSINRPAGIGDEMRIVLRANGTVWGSAALYRELDSPDFDHDDRTFLAGIADEVGEGLRRSLSRRPAPGAGAIAPGVVAFTAHGEIVSTTAEAGRLMDLMPGDAAVTLFTVAIRAGRDEHARARVRLDDGRWLLLHGGRMRGEDDSSPEVMVTLVPAPRAEIASVLLRLHGLSSRELEVAQLLMVGLATDEIAKRLHISRHTLRDHIKAIFAKVGATSRSELMSLTTEHSA